MVDVTLPNGQTLSMPSITDEDRAKRIAANYYKKNKDAQPARQVTDPTQQREIDRSGVDNSALRRFLARADNNEEYELRLKDSGFTPDMYMKDPKGVGYVIDRDKLTPELREKYDIQGQGLLSVEDEGVSFNDFQEFFAGNRGAIIGGTAASLAATGIGLPIAMVLTGAGSAAGYLLDEGLEYTGGLQAQSGREVRNQAFLEGILGAGGEVGGRALAKGFSLLFKGSGSPTANATRAEARKLIAEGARPTVRATNDAPIMGRLQAIYEGVFPNKAAAQKNADFIAKKIEETKSARGIQEDVDYNSLMKTLQDDIDRIYGEPADMLKNAENNLKNVVDQQIKGVMNLMGKPDPRGGKVVAEALDVAKRTFDEDVGELFAQANKMLGNKPIVDVSNVKRASKKIKEENRALELGDKGFFRFVDRMPEVVDVQTANSLRTALNHASFDPSIVGSVDSQLLTKLNSALANSFKESEAAARAMLEPGSIKGPDGKFIGKQQFKDMSDGFEMLRKAQNFYNKGVDRFKQPLTEKIYQHYMSGKNFNPNDILDPKFGIIAPNNARGLNRFLNTVAPSGRAAKAPPQSLKDVVPDIEVTLPTGQKGQLPDVIEQLPAEDSLRRYYDAMLVDQQRFASRIAQARGQGVEIREATRRQLAGMYLSRMFDDSRDLLGNIDAAKVAENINALGDTKKALFKNQEKQLMNALSDMAAMGKNVTPDQLAQFAGRPITDQIEAVNQLTKANKELQDIPFLNQIERGVREQDPDRILNAVLKKNNVSAVNYAKRILNDTPENPSPIMESVRDLALRKILSSAGDPSMQNAADFLEGVFQGTHSKAFRKQLDDYGEESLTQLFGKETKDGLYNLARYSRLVSNDPIKGLGGLAPAGIVGSIGLGAIFAGPVGALSTAAGLLVMSRLLRSKAFLKLISRPTGGRPIGTPGIDYDQLGATLEEIYRIQGQLAAAGLSSGKEKTSSAVERVQEISETVPAPTTPSVTVSSQKAVVPPRQPNVQVQYGTPNNALLGTNPMSQAINAEIARRLNR